MITDKQLIRKLDPKGKYNDEYVQARIDKVREENIKNEKRNINEGIEDIDLSMEYAFMIQDKKDIRQFSTAYIEDKVRKIK